MPKQVGQRGALHKLLRQNGLNQADIAVLLGRSPAYVSSRFCGKDEWGVQEGYAILQACGKSPEDFAVYFPPNGRENYPTWQPPLPQTETQQIFAALGDMFNRVAADPSILTGGKLAGIGGRD